ncbi:MAG: N-acetylneuraminate synthase family protein [Pseudorhodoplanes sp.]|uniref:N-acetylneuraminate synthase family protein n=1 Tax=Pseudorhodoplanes sp. TaxID=1934341 RepID=UPI003D0C1BF8
MKFGIREFRFADGDAPVVIGEIGVNHNGDSGLARRLIDVGAAAGVDIVKLQVFKSEKEISRFTALAPYQSVGTGAQNQLELCKALELSYPDLRALSDHCIDRKIGFLCSVFDSDSLAFVADDLRATSVKVASGEVTNLPFLEEIGRRRLGVILSTGGSTLAEIAAALAMLRDSGCPELVLLHCISSYPAPDAELNLRAIGALRDEFRLPVGFSDHSVGLEAAVAATALGAVAIEKHFTLDRAMPGPDHQASLEPEGLRRLVDAIKTAHAMLGDGIKGVAPSERENLPLIRRSLVASRPLRRGERLTRDMIEIKRPATGIAPGSLPEVLGRALDCDLESDQPITWKSLV